MEESCSKSGVVPQFEYTEYVEEPMSEVVLPGPLYRRNDPNNRSYRMKKRTPAQVYHCVQCNKHIKYPSKISEHIRKHTGEKPHVCLVCNQSFSQSHTLKTHMLSHAHEKPFKCSFCTAAFRDLDEKNEHEEQHMHHVGHPESMEDGCPPTYIHYAPPPPPPSQQQLDEPIHVDKEATLIFECPFPECGFQDYNETVVDEHIMEHQAYDREHGYVWGEEPREQQQPGSSHYPYFEEQFVPAVANEAVIGGEEPAEHEAYTEEVGGTAQIAQLADDIIIPRENHMFGEVLIDEVVEMIEEVDEVDEERVSVIVNPNPPKRGFKSVRDHEEANAAMTEMVVDAATLEMAAPTRHLKQGYPGIGGRKGKGKKAPNLDWIIDAVAKGVNVNDASPHTRKKPTIHKCKICGKVDKYPSKIAAHMRTHTGEKPFKCDICGMAFSQRTPMRLHLRRHLNQKPYECDVDGCNERFVSGAILKMHVEKKHLNKKKYVCHRGCGRVFSSAFNQRHHEKKCEQQSFVAWVDEEEEEQGANESEYEEEEEYEVLLEHQQTPHEFDDVQPLFLHQ